jgi:alkylhydroperoxidase/carboxymuconolactone decarboxylase family protein YurZ
MAYLPEIYKDFKKQYPDIARGYDALAKSCHEWGPLDAKCRRLVKLGVAIGLSSEGGVRSHVRRGLAEGITPEEIRHAILLAFTTAGYPTMIASLKWAEIVIQNQEKKKKAGKQS